MSRLTQSIRDSLAHSPQERIHDNGRWWGAVTLAQDALQLSTVLRELGLATADRVLIALPNSYAFAAVYTASLFTGTVAVPVNPNTPAPELEKAMRRYNAKAAFICQPAGQAWNTLLTAHGMSQVRQSGRVEAERFGAVEVWAAAGEHTHTVHPGDSLLTHSSLDRPSLSVDHWQSDTSDLHDPDEEAPAVLMYTSGTTGEPKGVLLKHRHLWAAATNVMTSHELSEKDVAYSILPLFHINAQVIVLLSTLCSRGRLVMAERFRTSTFWQTIEDQRVTWVSAVPTILTILSKAEDSPVPSRSLRFVRSASAPLPMAVLRQFETRFHVPVIESYGMTEAGGQICINPLPPGVHKPGSAGLPCRVQLRVVDEHRQPLTSGQTGEIEICGDNIIESYLLVNAEDDATGQAVATGAQDVLTAAADQGPVEVEVTARDDAATSEDGRLPWLPTGDIGFVDDDGYLFITGRAKEVINRAGEKFSPREVEEVLYEHPAVAKAAVAGIPDVTYGEQVVAWVIPSETADHSDLAQDLLLRCRASLAKYKCPATIYLVESLPVGPTGKVKKHLLQQDPAGALSTLAAGGQS